MASSVLYDIYTLCYLAMRESVHYRISIFPAEGGKEGGSDESHVEIKTRIDGKDLSNS